jgi:3-oxoacyl-[acyl-carrier-protein] synthase-3
MGHFHPETEIDNRFLEDLDIGTSDAWILERVGIRTRRSVLPLDYIRRTRNADVRAAQEASLYTNAETARRASLIALRRAGLNPSDIGLVLAGGCSAEMSIPAEACRVADALGIDAPAFDVSSACSSFGAQVWLLSALAKTPMFVLVVNAENNTRVIDYRDRSSAVLWGDATSAAIFSAAVPARLRVGGATLGSHPRDWRAVTIPKHGHFQQEGAAVQRFAIRRTAACLQEALPAVRARLADANGKLHFIGHQANLLMLEAARRRAGLAEAEHWSNVEHFGNTGAAGAPSVLSQHWNELAAGDDVLLVVVGAGLTWSSLHIDVEV